MKQCVRCKLELPLINFQERAPGYLYRQCRSCRLKVRHERYKNYPESKIKDLERSKKWYQDNKEYVSQKRKEVRSGQGKWYRIKHNYKLSKDQYEKILKAQNNACAICKKNKKLYVDHNHSCCSTEYTCGKCVRGLICQKCNIMMHYIDECRDLLKIGEAYALSYKIYENPNG